MSAMARTAAVTRYLRTGWAVVLIALCAQAASPRSQQPAAGRTAQIAVRTGTVDGVKLQYQTAGTGPAILLEPPTNRCWFRSPGSVRRIRVMSTRPNPRTLPCADSGYRCRYYV